MKNLLGKFHAELSQQRLASQAKPSRAEPSQAVHEKFVRKILFFFLSGKFHEKFVRKISCRKHASAWPCSAGLPLQKKWHLQHGQNLLSQHI